MAGGGDAYPTSLLDPLLPARIAMSLTTTPTSRFANRPTAKTRRTGSRKDGSGRPENVSTEENKNRVEELIQSQEDNPGRHKPIREVASDLEVRGLLCKEWSVI